MARCSICDHPHRHELDAQIRSGKPAFRIARETGLNINSLYRHRDNHLDRDRFLDNNKLSATEMETIEALRARDLELAEIQRIAIKRDKCQLAINATMGRVRIIMEISNLRGEGNSAKPVGPLHLVSFNEQDAERIVQSYIRHKQLSGGAVIDGQTIEPLQSPNPRKKRSRSVRVADVPAVPTELASLTPDLET